MKYHLFQYQFPAAPDLDDLNAFLARERVAAVEKHLVTTQTGTFLVFIVETVSGRAAPSTGGDIRIDYREVLNEADFRVFSQLRDERKRISTAEGVPPYVVFTNAQLASMVQSRARTSEDLLKLDGVGAGRVEKHAPQLLAILANLPSTT